MIAAKIGEANRSFNVHSLITPNRQNLGITGTSLRGATHILYVASSSAVTAALTLRDEIFESSNNVVLAVGRFGRFSPRQVRQTQIQFVDEVISTFRDFIAGRTRGESAKLRSEAAYESHESVVDHAVVLLLE